ncbi:tetratricopeptide repeat protein [Acaryochloris sp. IP29b_bin.137]|uniref:CHAT domain-containing protein n=1 Tax=Acaryochloris sp. IP29b_bin.137 TaxID=2969217 RepID=UPI00263312DD|nr:tetratricopeptide repeat protein [Acaryochloris sp. IP29b_bin.137]
MTSPDFSDSLTWLEQAKTYLQNNQYIDALQCIHQGLAFAPRNAEAWLQCGSVLQKLGFYGDAITANHNAQRLFGSPEAKLKTIPLEALLAKAQGHVTPLTSQPPPSSVPCSAVPDGDYDFWQRRALACTEAQDYDAALAAYDKVLVLKPQQAQSWYRRGLVLFRLHRFEDAIASFERALDYQPDLYQAWNNRASILIQVGQFKEAIYSYEQALRWTDKQLWQAWEDLGMAVLHVHGVDAAIDTLEQGIQALWCDSDDYELGCGSLHQCKGDIQAQYAWQQPSPPTMWKAAKLSYLKALDLLDFHGFPHQHLTLWQSLLKVRFYLQETAAIQTMLLEGAIKLQIFKQGKTLSSDQNMQIEDQFSGFQQLQVDWLIHQKQLKDAILWAEQCQDRALGRWRFGPNYEAVQLQYGDLQPLLNPQRAIIYWHLSPITLSTFILKHQEDPILYSASPHQPFDLSSPEKAEQSPVGQRFHLGIWQKNWDKAQSLSTSQASDVDLLGMGADWWLHGQAIHLLSQLKQILGIESFCQETLSGIQELILILPRPLRYLPMSALFPDNFVITFLPNLRLGINLLKADPPPPDHLLSIVPPGPSTTGDSSLAALEAQAIASCYRRNTQLGGLQLTQTTVTTALAGSGGNLYFTGLTTAGPAHLTPAWRLTDEHLLTVDDLLQMNWQAYPLVCLAGGPQRLTVFPSLGPDLATSLLAKGVQHVLQSLWQVNHCSRLLLMVHFHRLLHQNCNPVHALQHAQHWLRKLTYADIIQWLEALADTVSLDDQQATLLEHLQSNLRNTAQSSAPNTFPFNHPWYWAGYTIAGNFPEILVWNELS